ncbi:hypothetical protein EYF80_051519 [Liparis tanakae]|uniref:Uncharacterized protein n=1 Tax=Liparis tanakae TaxID=230148 RepID=A0A4Z2FAQ3_9TELE|nr:hypothetical protein EYF80_051519 [Liparis tanakae]
MSQNSPVHCFRSNGKKKRERVCSVEEWWEKCGKTGRPPPTPQKHCGNETPVAHIGTRTLEPECFRVEGKSGPAEGAELCVATREQRSDGVDGESDGLRETDGQSRAMEEPVL